MRSGIQRLDPQKLSDDDLSWLLKIEPIVYTGFTARDIVLMAIQDKLQFWRIVGAAQGLIITEVMTFPKGRELRIWGMAGKGVFPLQVKYLIDDYLKVCIRWNCRWLGFTNLHKAADRIYARYMGPPNGTFFLKEL